MDYQEDKQYRLPHYDYSKPGEYFVTINSFERERLFGKIKNERMFLSPIGEIIRDNWLSMPKRFLNVKLDEWVIMPDHIATLDNLRVYAVAYGNRRRLYAWDCGDKTSGYPQERPS